MVYNHGQIFSQVEALLSVTPRFEIYKLAQNLQVSRHTLETVVKEATGKPYREYRKTVLLERALDLLTYQGELSHKQIAGMLGYGSAEGFSRFVKRTTGKTPTDIRRKGTSDPPCHL